MDPKEILARAALEYIRKANIIGMGTGRTVRKIIEEMHKESQIFSPKTYIASSIDSELILSSYGFKVISIFLGVIPEVYIDSFDHLIKLDDSFVMIKGGGGALLREKMLSYHAKYRVFLGEYTKFVNRLDHKILKIPIEIVPASLNYVLKALSDKLNLKAEIRLSNGKMGPELTDNGNILIDAIVEDKNVINSLCSLDFEISKIPGVIETGIFCNNLFDIIILANENGRLEIIKKGKNSG